MTRYLVAEDNIRCAICEAIECQDTDPQGNFYLIGSCMDVVSHVLRLLARYKVTESEQTENSKQDAGREIDASEYQFIQLRSNELVEMICSAYQKGKDY